MVEASFYTATVINLGINLIYTVLALFIGLLAFIFFDKKMFPEINFVEEIRKGNIAASLFACTKLLFIAVVISFALQG